MEPILVTYATKRGSTREVAADVARVLRQNGFEVEITPARDVKDVSKYGAVVLGGALYMGRLHKDARRLLARERERLAACPVAVFALGPRGLETKDVEGASAQLERALAKVPEIKPVTKTIFGGVFDPATLPFPFRRMPKSDARDWDAIQAWGGDVARLFAAATPPAR